jgi:ABC-type multidrug transport system ATPase subunit
MVKNLSGIMTLRFFRLFSLPLAWKTPRKMSEPILMALVQLFAITAAAGKHTHAEKERSIVASFLKQHLTRSELEEYLKLFDELLFFHLPPEGETVAHDTAVKITDICRKVNTGLHHRDKLIVFIKFLEFMEEEHRLPGSDFSDLDEAEEEYILIIARSFNIGEQEAANCRAFILSPGTGASDHPDSLVIDSYPESALEHARHIQRERLAGQIAVLYIPSIHAFICRYLGEDDLFLNGEIIIPYRSLMLNHGSILKNLKISPVYFSDIASQFLRTCEGVAVEFTAREIEFRFRNSRNGIHPFSFTATSGELIGVMGGSGVGKSTLLNVLNGALGLHSGSILINGYDLSRDKGQLEGVIGFVPQDDLLIEELTVFQNLYYNAKLCFSDYSEKQILKAVMKILSDMGLAATRHLKVGDPLNKFISGGQRKRLNIALELLREPDVLFVDEPTSGLSSVDSENVMLLLKEQTLKNRLVMVNIHQPSSDIYKLFDKILVMDKGGYPVYYGNPIDALRYFKTLSNYVNPDETECFNCGYVNPEQVLQITEARLVNEYGKLTANRKTTPEEWYTLFRKNIQPELEILTGKRKLPRHQFSIPDPFTQFRIFSIRNLRAKITNRQYLMINLLEAPFLAALLAFLTRYFPADTYIFGQNSNLVAYLFMSVVVSLFLGLMVSAEEIIHDRRIMKREAFLQLSRFSYLNSKVVFLFALSAIQTITYVIAGNLILDIRGMTLSYFLILFSSACFANMVGLNISSSLNSVVAIYILIPFILVPQLLLSGTIVPFDKLNPQISTRQYVPLVGDLMASRWTFEALAVEQFRNNRYERNFFPYDKEISHWGYITSFGIPALKSELDACRRNLRLGIEPEKTANYFAILQHEIPELASEAGLDASTLLPLLNASSFSEESVNKAGHLLDSMSVIFSWRLANVTSRRDALYERMVSEMGSEGINQLRENYHNENLAGLVMDKTADNKILEGKGRLIRKKDPIFMDPEPKNGRAHFYAPVKNLGNWQIDTFWFNFGVIWLMSLVLYVMLLHDTLRKSFELIERVMFRR